jgi:hypothetical protein
MGRDLKGRLSGHNGTELVRNMEQIRQDFGMAESGRVLRKKERNRISAYKI